MSRPLVSIVTPTLNQGRFIEHTLRSLKSQTYGAFEHIVIDGGSTDETLDILRRYESTYPLRWTSEPDEGMYDAINKGMGTARGDILAYLNSDDLYFPWTLQVVVDAFDGRPDADFVFGDALGVYDDSHEQDPRFQPPVRFESLLRGGYLVQPAVFWRRAVQDDVGEFDTHFKLAGDLDWWLRAGPDRRYHRVDQMVAVERDHRDAKRMAQWDRLLAESHEARERVETRGLAQVRLLSIAERFRAWWSRRLLWWRFVRASSGSGAADRPWGRFFDAGEVEVARLKAVVRQVPWLGVRTPGGSIASSVDWLEPSDETGG